MIPLKTDCRHFRGDIPCKPHKLHGVHCVDEHGNDCRFYDPTDRRILIIKLGAIGDVIRTTPLLRKIKEVYPRARITWLTHSPEVIPASVDDILPFTPASITTLRATRFDILYNLDKDREACALASLLSAGRKYGFVLKDGLPAPVNKEAEHKYLTGVFDDLSRANTKSYPEELFELCGFPYSGEHYILDSFADEGLAWKLSKKRKVVGLNTGCGGRWVSRLWDDKNWIALARQLKRKGFEVLLLGGELEDNKNKRIARAAGAKYFGHFPLRRFINLVSQCDLVVTGVTMGLHIAVGLGRKVVLFNNIFNKYEFELFGKGRIIEPGKACRCFYQPVCTNPDYRCMDHLTVRQVFDSCTDLLASR